MSLMLSCKYRSGDGGRHRRVLCLVVNTGMGKRADIDEAYVWW